MTFTDALHFLNVHWVDLSLGTLLIVQQWLAKTKKVEASNYIDLVVNVFSFLKGLVIKDTTNATK